MARNLKAETVLLLAAPLVFGVWAVYLGQDANWDLRNYHWYNAYLLVDWRFNRDLAPAGIQTFQSSLFDLPWFVLAQELPAAAVGFVIGAVQSANFVLLYLLAKRLVTGTFLAIMIALIGVAGPISRNQIGTTFNDFIVTIGIVGALYLVALALDPKEQRPSRPMFAAGVTLGLTVAGKLTAAPFALAAVLAVAAIDRPWRTKLALMSATSAGGLVSGLIFLGPWSWWLWSLFGNPIFPFMNGIFHSPWTTLPDLFNPWQRPPEGLIAWLTFPWRFTIDPHLISANGTTDERMLAGYILVPAALILRRLLHAPRLSQPMRYLLCFAPVSYVLWAALFDVDRYAIVLAMIAPLLMAAALFDLQSRLFKPAFTALIVVLAYPRGASYERVPWAANFITADLPAIADPAHTLIVLGNKPLGYLVPLLPEKITAVQLQDDLAPLEDPHALWTKRLKATIDQPWAHMIGFLVTPNVDLAGPDPYVQDAIQRFSAMHLTADLPTCRLLRSTFTPEQQNLIMCLLLRSNGRAAVWPTVQRGHPTTAAVAPAS